MFTGLAGAGAWREIVHSLVSLLIRTPVLSDLCPTLMTLSDPSYLPKSPSPNSITLGVRISTYEFGDQGRAQLSP